MSTPPVSSKATPKITINFVAITKRYHFQRQQVFDLKIDCEEGEESPPRVKAHVAHQHILTTLGDAYPHMIPLLSLPGPIEIFNFSSYEHLWQFSNLSKPREAIAFLQKHSSLGSPGYWGKQMNAAVMVKGGEEFDFAQDQNPVYNPYPSAIIRISSGYHFNIKDLVINHIRDVPIFEQVETDFKKRVFKKRLIPRKIFDELRASRLGEGTAEEFEFDPELPPDWEDPKAQHILDAVNKGERADIYNMRAKKEMTMNGIFQFDYQRNILPEQEIETISQTQNWPDGKCLYVLFGDTYVTYGPRNDIGAWTPHYPLWAGEICSNDRAHKGMESDYFRMLFQGAGLVSFLNWVEYGLEGINGSGFVYPLAYEDRDFVGRIYLLREDAKGFRYTLIEECKLATARGAARFLKFMYHMLEQPTPKLEADKLRQAWINVVSNVKPEQSMSAAVGASSGRYDLYPGTPSKGKASAKAQTSPSHPHGQLVTGNPIRFFEGGESFTNSEREEEQDQDQGGGQYGLMITDSVSGEMNVVQIPARPKFPSRRQFTSREPAFDDLPGVPEPRKRRRKDDSNVHPATT